MIMKNKLHVRNGDIVQVISGKYKGQIGKITKILSKTSKVIIENINLKTKHMKPNQKEESGQIVNIEAPIHSSNVMLYSKENKICSRYKIVFNEQNKKCRQLNKTKEIVK